MLEEEVASAIVEVGPDYDGQRLIDPKLGWLQQEEDVMCQAVQLPGERDRWHGGGAIRKLVLPKGTKVLLAGDGASIEAARDRLEATEPA